MTTAPPARRDPVLWLILAASIGLSTHRIGHVGLHYSDESYHAIVARNLLKHPLKPTLIDVPYLAYDPTHWGENHVWLHKPIVPLWTIAGSFAVLGVNNIALRLPSALLATGAVALTYLIGRRLFGRPTALIAAGLQAINPAITMLVQGFLFSDHVDISLLFWVEVGVYFLARAIDSGSWADVLAVGVAQGMAYLSKSYLGAILIGLAATAWLLPKVGMASKDASRLTFRHLLGLMGATLVTVAPWTIHCARNFPAEFAHEHGYVFTHLGAGVEGWGAPWDRLVFDYLIGLYHGFYPPLIVAGVVLVGSAVIGRDGPLLFLYAWLFGVLAPHVVASTKTPSATLIAMPAGFLLLARLMVEGWRGRSTALAAWLGFATVGLIWPAPIGRFGKGYPDPPASNGVMLGATWVFEHLALAGSVGLAAFLALWWVNLGLTNFDAIRPPLSPALFWGKAGQTRTNISKILPVLRCLAVASTLIIGVRVTLAAWAVTERSENRPFVFELAEFARDRLPGNAVLLFDGVDRGDHQNAMFLLDRTCYQLRGRSADELARQVRQAGGVPFVVTAGTVPWPRRFAGTADPRGLYEWQGAEVAAGPADRPR
ncbi:ArnT family glycosyltransferase [Tundrisphaera lichenicola]|uniref:ArnT family glycosyltransferase n=1 Tax=Tundrisphaera lichenicola TaxID=2029860 RepID=UPI003EC123AF